MYETVYDERDEGVGTQDAPLARDESYVCERVYSVEQTRVVAAYATEVGQAECADTSGTSTLLR